MYLLLWVPAMAASIVTAIAGGSDESDAGSLPDAAAEAAATLKQLNNIKTGWHTDGLDVAKFVNAILVAIRWHELLCQLLKSSTQGGTFRNPALVVAWAASKKALPLRWQCVDVSELTGEFKLPTWFEVDNYPRTERDLNSLITEKRMVLLKVTPSMLKGSTFKKMFFVVLVFGQLAQLWHCVVGA